MSHDDQQPNQREISMVNYCLEIAVTFCFILTGVSGGKELGGQTELEVEFRKPLSLDKISSYNHCISLNHLLKDHAACYKSQL